ncbi:hypothetical protein KUV57_13120 [Epibacterium sp. DP7N7-1]|nr:hypothetical protein [Epibacterium sp. DP7N7-1]
MSKFAKILTRRLAILTTTIIIPFVAVAEDAKDMPAIVLPDDDVQAATSVPSSNDAVLDLLRAQITEKYLSDKDQAVDNARLEALLSGEYISDYDTGDHNPVQFSNGVFEHPLPVAPSGAEPSKELSPIMTNTDAGFTLTPAAIRAMSNMSRDQIEAIALMVQLAQDPTSLSVSPQTSLRAIPSLSDENIDETVPEQLLAALSLTPAERPTLPRVVNVGNGQNLALENWEVILSPDGTVQLSNAVLPGSRFPVAEGDVVGQFGRVTKVSVDAGDLFVEFETGDRILGETVSLDHGIPAIEGEIEDRSIYGGEILVSQSTPRQETAQTTNSDLAVTRSLRPVARPSAKEDHAKSQVKDPVALSPQADFASEITTTPEVAMTSSLAPSKSVRPQSKPSRL